MLYSHELGVTYSTSEENNTSKIPYQRMIDSIDSFCYIRKGKRLKRTLSCWATWSTDKKLNPILQFRNTKDIVGLDLEESYFPEL
jgi:hypothetical protein